MGDADVVRLMDESGLPEHVVRQTLEGARAVRDGRDLPAFVVQRRQIPGGRVLTPEEADDAFRPVTFTVR